MKRCAAVLIAVGLLAVPGTAAATTITPDVTSDDFTAAPDGSCSLREAVQAAITNAAYSTCPAGEAGTDTIVLTSPAATPYTLTLGADDEDANAQGDLDYGSGGALIIRSATSALIRATVTDRVIDLESGGNLTLENVTLDDGDVSAVAADEDSRGGNIRATGTNTLLLKNVTVRDGTARDGGGGIYTSTATNLTVNDSTIVNNTVEGASGGSSGGGIFVLGSDQAFINRSTISGNDVASASLGNIKGGGIRASVDNGAPLEIADTEISNNTVDHTGVQPADQSFGGGLSIASQGVIRRSLISGNETIASGDVERGGGLHTDGGDAGEVLLVVNTTFYDNTVGDAGNDGEGGGAYIGGNIGVDFNHDTFQSNSATDPAAGDNLHRGASSTSPVRRKATLLTSGLLANSCAGLAITSLGYNVTNFSDPDCGSVGTDGVFLSLGLVGGGPADNGGFVDTTALLATSPARDFVPPAQCSAEGMDARAYPRPLPVAVGSCDVGAYELHSCDGGATILNGPYAPCFSAIPIGPSTPPVDKPAAAKKCKKSKKKKKGRAGAAAKKKGCKKKKKKRK